MSDVVIEYARNPVHTKDGGIDLLVKFSNLGEEVPFHASINDYEPHGRELYEMASFGQFGEIAEYLPAKGSIEDVLLLKLSEIQKEKKRVRDAGVMIDDVLFDADEAARIAYLEFFGSITMDPSYFDPSWKASGTTFVRMDAALFARITNARRIQESAAIQWQEHAVAEVNALYANADYDALSKYSVVFHID